MGGILSGNRTLRVGKPSTASLPMVRLVHAELYTLEARQGPRLVPHGDGWAMVTFQLREWPVQLKTTPLNFGGKRRWLVCPSCSHRREALYVAHDVLACRACLGLGYESQNENRRQLLFRRANAIRARLGWSPGIVSPDGDRPHRMHRSSYNHLRTELEGLTNALLGYLEVWIEKAEARLDRQELAMSKRMPQGHRGRPATE